MIALSTLAAALLVSLPGAPPRAFDAAALAALPQATATASFHESTTTCTGPRLDAVLAAAGAPAGAALRGPALTLVAVAQGQDGYRAAFTLADLDPLLGDQSVVVATACGGAPTPPRLLAAGDKRGARAVRDLVSVTVKPMP